MEELVGFFLIITIVLGIAGVVFVGKGKDWFKEHVVYRTSFEEGYYIKPGSRVKLFKIDIGKVESVRLTEENRVDVKMKILAEYAHKIREDSIAKVESPTFIGSEYISITPGSPDKPAIPPGGLIASVRKESISDYVKQFELDKKSKALTIILEDLGKLVADLSDNKKGIPALMNNANQMLFSLKDSEKGIPKTIANLNDFMEKFNDPRGDFSIMLKNFSALSMRMEAIVDNLEKTLVNINQISTQIAHGEGSAGKLLMNDELYRSLNSAIGRMDLVLQDLKETTSRLPILVERVDKSLKDIDPLLKNFSDSLSLVPGLLEKVDNNLKDVERILDSVQKNFLIRAFIPRVDEKNTIEIQLR
jgi:phospholipid/cholesterol/gamma-HCH transport system substrate-binding protein